MKWQEKVLLRVINQEIERFGIAYVPNVILKATILNVNKNIVDKILTRLVDRGYVEKEGSKLFLSDHAYKTIYIWNQKKLVSG